MFKILEKYKRLGTTIDDALGEAFDKTAKLLGVEFPGGPQIEIMAEKGRLQKNMICQNQFLIKEDVTYLLLD